MHRVVRIAIAWLLLGGLEDPAAAGRGGRRAAASAPLDGRAARLRFAQRARGVVARLGAPWRARTFRRRAGDLDHAGLITEAVRGERSVTFLPGMTVRLASPHASDMRMPSHPRVRARSRAALVEVGVSAPSIDATTTRFELQLERFSPRDRARVTAVVNRLRAALGAPPSRARRGTLLLWITQGPDGADVVVQQPASAARRRGEVPRSLAARETAELLELLDLAELAPLTSAP